ncbi:MAG: response regulator [Bdellovibrionales bacterium]
MLNNHKTNILVVDDRPEGILSVQAVLTDPSYNIVTASSGEQALARVLEYDFSVILLDVQMSGMDGFETAAVIKQREKSKDIPIVFLTAINKDHEYVYKGYNSGAVDYIFKPFDPEILKLKVGVFIDLYRKSVQLKQQSELLRQGEVRERARQLATFQLESFNRYRNLADAVPHIIWKFKADGTLDYTNKYWLEYSGLSLEQSLGSGWQSTIHPEDLKKLLELWEEAKLEQKNIETECRIKRALDNSYHWHIFKGVPELEPNGRVSSWIVTNTDIESHKKIEQDLIRAKDEASAANQAKTNFLANVSHEIRTPLGAVIGFAELMSNPQQSHEERLNCIATIRRNGDLLSRLIGDILDLSKIEAGHLEMEKTYFVLPELLAAVTDSLSYLASEKGIGLKLHLDTAIPKIIYSDPTRVRQILLNIIGNAVKFTSKGEVIVSVKMVAKDIEHKLLSVDVTDQGHGITEEQAQKLFQPFIQADSSTTRKYGGTGLGLSLSRKLAKALGGDVILTESVVNKGSTFTITFDVGSLKNVMYVQKIAPINEVTQRQRQSVLPNLKGTRVLLVEDSIDNQELIAHILKLAEVDVDLANNGEEGVNKALKGDYDVILMDIQMPVLDGYKATQKLRSQSYQKPILALTAHALREERDRCLAVGFNDHLTKPINRKELFERIAQYSQPQLTM